MKRETKKYAGFVDHPRYGRFPNYTGLNPDPFSPDVRLQWHTWSRREFAARFQTPVGDVYWSYRKTKRIPNTAIAADLSRQTPATVSVTHYFDLERICCDCERPFIFFAEEQKHWYEELGFGLDSDCVRCVDCRKRQQGIARKRQRYEDLFHVPNRSDDENLEMADCCLSLIESETFSTRQTQRVRMLLKTVSTGANDAAKSRTNELLARVRAIETQNDAQPPAQET